MRLDLLGKRGRMEIFCVAGGSWWLAVSWVKQGLLMAS